jgi:thermosome
MDKMLVDSLGDVTITNDGVTILKEIEVEHPAAKMIVEVAKTQDQEAGDGTTTAVILTGELLKQAESLLEADVHPTVIARGYKLAADRAISVLKEIAFPVKPEDKELLKAIARTAMGGRTIGDAKDFLADLVVRAVLSVAEEVAGERRADIDNVKVEKKHGGTIQGTKLIDGIVLDKERVHPRMPERVENAKIALINRALEVKKTEVSEEIRIRDPAKLNEFLAEEERTLKAYVDAIKKSGANVVVCQKGIDDLVQHYLAKEGIYAVRRAKESDMEALTRATGGRVVTALDDLSPKDLGNAKLVYEEKVAEDDMTFVTGCRNPKAVSLLIRGGTEHVVEEVERTIHDALKVVSIAVEDGTALPGGGASDLEASLRLREYAASQGGREQLAIEAFAKALEIVPWTLAENAGLNMIDTIIGLKSSHEGKKGANLGIDVYSGKPSDMRKANVIEPLRVKTQAIESATEAATMILRIDDVIASKHTEAPKGGGGEGHGGMPPGMGGMGGMM